MSAREMMTFVHFFSIMIGDLIPENDEVWNFSLTLIKIVDILLSFQFTESKILNLKQLIYQHNSIYVRLFHDTLKPKHHFLIHYPTIIQYSGPPSQYWCFRFEGKHKELGSTKKCQYKFAHILLQPSNQELILKEKYSTQLTFR